MSDNSWQNKSYGEYFESLGKQLNKTQEARKTARTDTVIAVSPKEKRRRKGLYMVLRVRKSVWAVTFAVLAVIAGIILISGSGKAEVQISKPSSPQAVAEEKVEKVTKISYYSNESTVDIPAENDAKTAIIIDKSNNTVLAERKAHERTFPASTTKIMTLLVAAENLKDMEDTFTMTYEITDPLFTAEASVAGFLDGEQVKVKDLFYGTALPSGADAAVGLAIKTAGSEEEFVKLMNAKVTELGLENTHFANVTGLHDEQNYSSAYDMAIILDTALQNELCKEILSTYQYTTAKTPQNPDGILLSNTIFEYMYGTEPETATILGGKTGYVDESGYCIASYGKCNQNGNEYIVVTLGNSSRWPAFHGQIDLYKEFAK